MDVLLVEDLGDGSRLACGGVALQKLVRGRPIPGAGVDEIARVTGPTVLHQKFRLGEHFWMLELDGDFSSVSAVELLQAADEHLAVMFAFLWMIHESMNIISCSSTSRRRSRFSTSRMESLLTMMRARSDVWSPMVVARSLLERKKKEAIVKIEKEDDAGRLFPVIKIIRGRPLGDGARRMKKK